MPGSEIVAIDCGTQSVRCLIIDVDTGAHRVGATEPIILARSGLKAIEVDPLHLAQATIRVLRATIALCRQTPISLAITNMRETAVAWSKETGQPVHDGIMWMSQQSQNIVQRWENEGLAPLIRERTGLTNHTFFFGSKIAWLLNEKPDLKRQAFAGKIAIGTIDAWLLYVLSGGTAHATDVSNASRYQLLNLQTLQWDPDLSNALGIPASALPQVKPTSAHFGFTDARLTGVPIPITGMIGDQQASLLGHDCVQVGDAKATFGTSCVVGVNLGRRPSEAAGLVTSVAWADKATEAVYEMEGSAFHSGFTVTWLRRTMSLPSSAQDGITQSSMPADRRVCVVPAFTEMGAPTWLKGTGATISGLTMDTAPTDILRAGIESMAYQAFELVSAVPLVTEKVRALSVDGGAANNDYLCQTIADLTGRVVVRPPSCELTGFGAARAAAATIGLDIPTVATSAQRGRLSDRFIPSEDRSYAAEGYAHWHDTVRKHLG